MDIFETYAVDPELIKNGAKFELPGGGHIMVKRIATDPDFLLRRAVLLDEDRELPKHKQRSMRDITLQAFAETLIPGWEGLTSNGLEFKYSVENARMMLEALPELYMELYVFSNNRENYQAPRADAKAAA